MILDEALSAELIPPPRKAASPNNADCTRRCRYHKNNGYTTEECQALKIRLKNLSKMGTSVGSYSGAKVPSDPHEGANKTKGLLPPEGTRKRPPTRASTKERRPLRRDERKGDKQIINTIVGGFVGGGSSNNARKKHSRVVHQVKTMLKMKL